MKCPFCDYEIPEEAECDLEDIGCPSCRRCFDITDYEEEDAEEENNL